MKKKQLLGSGCAAVLVLLLIGIWNLWFSSTRVAFVNYQVISLGQISKANDNSFIKIAEVSTDELDKLTSYDMVFINAMGMRITEEQRAQIQKAADGGLPILTTSATNPANEIISLDSIQADTLRSYLGNGGRRNYRSMLNYVRKHIDGKLISVDEPEAVTERSKRRKVQKRTASKQNIRFIFPLFVICFVSAADFQLLNYSILPFARTKLYFFPYFCDNLRVLKKRNSKYR